MPKPEFSVIFKENPPQCFHLIQHSTAFDHAQKGIEINIKMTHLLLLVMNACG